MTIAEASIEIIDGGGNVAPYRMTPDLVDAIRYAGREPSDYNVMSWPTGASRWGSIRLIFGPDDLATVYGGDPYVTLRLGGSAGITFDQMIPLPPKPVIITSGTGVVYEVELVDDRYLWSRVGFDDTGLNISLDDKSEVFTDSGRTVSEATAALRVRDALERVIDAVDDFAPEDAGFERTVRTYFPTLAEDGPLSYDGWRDITGVGMSCGEVVDKLLALAGHVMCVMPNLTYATLAVPAGSWPESSTGDFTPQADSGTATWRYACLPISDGIDGLSDLLTDHSTSIIAGGVHSTPAFNAGAAGGLPVAGIGTLVGPPFGTMQTDVPSTVRVHFPIAATTQLYARNEQDGSTSAVDWQMDRFEVVETATGTPVTDRDGGDADVSENNSTAYSVFDSTWATMDDARSVTNSGDLSTRGDDVATFYYDRFRSGAGDILLGGVVPVVPYSGAGCIEWRFGLRGPTTRVLGETHDPIFGWRQDETLRARDIMSTGWVRSMPRPDGGVLLDVPKPYVDVPVIKAVVKSSSSLATNRWTYVCEPVEWDGTNKKFITLTSTTVEYTAYNRAEMLNTASIALHGYDLTTTDYTLGVAVIPDDTPVDLIYDRENDVYTFSEPNELVVSCITGGFDLGAPE